MRRFQGVNCDRGVDKGTTRGGKEVEGMPVGWLQFLIDMSPTGWTLTCMSIKSNDAAPGEGDWQWQEEKDETTGRRRRRRRVLWESWHTLIGSKWILIFVWFDFTRFDCTECGNEHARSPAGNHWRGWLCLHPTAGSCLRVFGLRSVAIARRAPLFARPGLRRVLRQQLPVLDINSHY